MKSGLHFTITTTCSGRYNLHSSWDIYNILYIEFTGDYGEGYIYFLNLQIFLWFVVKLFMKKDEKEVGSGLWGTG